MELERTAFPGPMARPDLDALVVSAHRRNVPLWHVLTVEQRLPEDAVADALSASLGLTRVRIDALDIAPDALKLLTPRVARQYVCLPIAMTPKRVTLAMANPQDVSAIDAVQFASSRNVQPVIACRREILDGIDRHYPQHARSADAAPEPGVFTAADGDDLIDLDVYSTFAILA